MKRIINLNKNWKLSCFDRGVLIKNKTYSFDMPFNVETVVNNGKELFKGLTTIKNEEFEKYDYVIEKHFSYRKDANRVFLHVDKVDCFCRYYLNNTLIFESNNAHVSYDIDVTDAIEDRNILKLEFENINSHIDKQDTYENTRRKAISTIRKPAHSFGWDIFPRAISCGVYGTIELHISDENNIEDVNYYTDKIIGDKAYVLFDVELNKKVNNAKIVIEGKCGDSSFKKIFNQKDRCIIEIDKPKLWWPLGYGKANLYKTKISVVVGNRVVDYRELRIGIRTVKLIRTETMLDKNHCFKFVINGVEVFLNGSNYVPVTPYYSLSKERIKKALEYWKDTKSNILRVWGGGTYEDEYLYDYCDHNGILVWQDFMSACIQIDSNIVSDKQLEYEYINAINRLKTHCCIVLWAGDNEIDESCVWEKREGGTNHITRELLPKIIKKYDKHRDYLPSSPYIPKGYYQQYSDALDIFNERHLWGARDYFKADYYRNSKAHFISECGYQGVPNYKSLCKMFDKNKLWPIFNDEWILHSSDQKGDMYRVNWTYKQVIQLFGREPNNLNEFVTMSQISQAEALKYFIERMRIRKPYTSGIIWWNMIDGWPQISDAIVDYYHDKKLAYSYVKKSQETVCLMFDEMKDWNYDLYANNNSLRKVNGTYRVYDIDDGKILLSGKFKLNENENIKIDSLPLYYSDKKFLVIEYKINGNIFYNHYLCGSVPFELDKYNKWLKKYENL